jgi:hypothetical protein
MKRRKKSAPEQVMEFPVWTQEQAERARPYIASILRTVREDFLQLQQNRRKAKRLAQKQGRPRRQDIIEQDEANREATRLENEVAEGVQELLQMNVHCVDPVNGLAMIPFVQQEQLAWFVFELFDQQHLRSWRFHYEDLAVRRPLSEAKPELPDKPVIV